jgi:hypothetical protein
MKKYWFYSVLTILGFMGSFFLFKQKKQVTDDSTRPEESEEYSWYI